MILEVLEFGFMQRALIAGIAVAITSSVVGLFLVLRRNSLFGDALSHAAFGGIAIGACYQRLPSLDWSHAFHTRSGGHHKVTSVYQDTG